MHDDVVFIQNNPDIRNFNDLGSLFLKPVLLDQEIAAANTYYRPVLDVLYRLQYLFSGPNPFGYHLFNVIVHVINSLLVYQLFSGFKYRVSLKEFQIWLVGLLFLLHPVQSQAVASIAGVSNLLFSLLCLLSFKFYMDFREGTAARKIKNLSLSLACFILALFTKEQAVVLPLLIVLYELCFDKANILKRPRLSALGVYLLTLIGYFLFRQMIGLGSHGEFFSNTFELVSRLKSIPKILLIYLGLIFVPVDLHYYRSIDVLDPAGLFIILFVIVGLALWRAKVRQADDVRRVLCFGLGWFAILLLPVLNFLPLIIEYSSVSVAEHFLYLPLAGFLIFAVLLLPKKFEQGLIVLGFLIALIFLAATIKQNTYWRSEVALFERTVTFEKKLGRVFILLGKAYYHQKDFDKATASYQRALAIMQAYAAKVKDPKVKKFYTDYLKEIHFDLAHCSQDQGDIDLALKEYNEALLLGPKDIATMNNISFCYIEQGRIREAKELLQNILEIAPDFPPAKNNLEILNVQTKSK